MKKIYEDMEREAEEFGKSIREDIRNSKHGLAKIIGIEAIPIVMGFTLGSTARVTGANWVPAVPLAMDLMWNAQG